jgi:hypothetical protein
MLSIQHSAAYKRKEHYVRGYNDATNMLKPYQTKIGFTLFPFLYVGGIFRWATNAIAYQFNLQYFIFRFFPPNVLIHLHTPSSASSSLSIKA